MEDTSGSIIYGIYIEYITEISGSKLGHEAIRLKDIS
jgi:hypothetical protein